MLHLPESLMNRLNQTESAVFQLCSFTVFRKDPFFRLFSLFYSLLETPNSWFLQDLRQNGVGRAYERVNMISDPIRPGHGNNGKCQNMLSWLDFSTIL